MKIRKFVAAMMAAGLVGFGGHASAGILIDGIEIEAGSIFELGELFEAEMLGDGIGNDNGIIDQVGEQLVGIGRITSIRRGSDSSVIWNDGDNGKELTIYFDQFFAESLGVSADGLGVPNALITFSGGVITLYSQAVGTFAPGTTQAGGIPTATAGTPWLTLVGAPLVGMAGAATGDPITLTSLAQGVDPLNPFGSGNVFGQGRLDVTGGPAAPYLDTNTFQCLTGQGAPNCPYSSDKSFSSEGGLQPGSGSEWVFTGNLTVRDFAVVEVPEPGSLALVGLALAGLGFSARRKKAT